MLQPNVGTLLDAISENDDEKIQACLDSGVPVAGGSNFANTPLHYAAFQGKPKYVHWFVRLGADLEARNDMNRTPLHTAAQQLKIETVAALIELGAKVDPVDVLGKTPKDLALDRRAEEHQEIVAFLDAAVARQAIEKIMVLSTNREHNQFAYPNPA